MSEQLTPREREILDLVAEGLTYAKIARRLGLEESSVAVYMHRAAQKLPGEGSPLRKALAFAADQEE